MVSRRRSSCWKQDFAGDAGSATHFVVIAELVLADEVHALCLLLLAQLQAVAHDLRLPVFAVLSGSVVTLFDGALVGETLCALQEELHAFATAKAAHCIFISSQVFSYLI